MTLDCKNNPLKMYKIIKHVLPNSSLMAGKKMSLYGFLNPPKKKNTKKGTKHYGFTTLLQVDLEYNNGINVREEILFLK